MTAAGTTAVDPVIDAMVGQKFPNLTGGMAEMLQAWADRKLGVRKADGAMFLLEKTPEGWALTGLDGHAAGTAPTSDITDLKPNAGVRELIGAALVQFTLTDPDPVQRMRALDAIARSPAKSQLAP